MKILKSSFKVEEINPEGEKFRNTSRVYMTNEDMKLILDYHNQLLNLIKNQIVEIILFDDDNEDVPQYYNYVMGGKVYKINEDGDYSLINASFGGLCLLLRIKKGILTTINEFSDLVIGVRILE